MVATRDPPRVHILDPLMHVITPGPDLIQPLRLQSVLLLRPPRHRVQRRVGDHGVAELPHVSAVIAVHQPRRVAGVPRRQMINEHVGRLDNVIVHTDQNQIIALH
jgi:hypothetical protein